MTDALKIEKDKEYLLRNGYRMKCIEKGEMDGRPIIHGAWWSEPMGRYVSAQWEGNGRWTVLRSDSVMDIISEAPKPIEVDTLCWVDDAGNHWPEFAPSPYGTKGVAKKRVQFTILPGEGL